MVLLDSHKLKILGYCRKSIISVLECRVLIKLLWRLLYDDKITDRRAISNDISLELLF